MLTNRRNWIKQSTLATAGTLMVPRFLKAAAQGLPAGEGDRILIMVQLSGGNDGLNTIIPVKNDLYFTKRPRLGIKGADALSLTDEASIHSALPALREWFHAGEMLVLNDVGYPNPDRSHFRSMDIWHSASGAHQYWNTGWLGRYLDARCHGCDRPTQVLELDDVLSLANKGQQYKALALTDLRRLKQAADTPQMAGFARYQPPHHEPMADYLYKTLADTLQSADYLQELAKKGGARLGYPDSELGKSMQTIASLMAGGANTRVYYTSHGSFDTHINQQATQARLFKDLNDSLAALVKDLKQLGLFKQVLIVTFSEFGRRVAQNASGGTDHGGANNMVVIGGGLRKAGFYNSLPDLSNLQDGDLQHRIDFREVYATILNRWLDAPASVILQQDFKPLDFL